MSLLWLTGKRKVGWGTLGMLAAAWLLLALQPCAAAMAAAQSDVPPAAATDCPHCLHPDAEPAQPTADCGDRLCQLESPSSATTPEKPGSGSNQGKTAPVLIWLLPPPLANLSLNDRAWSDTPISLTVSESPVHLLNCVFLN